MEGMLRVGGRNKFTRLPYPRCSCGKPATVSKSQNGATKHSCLDCLQSSQFSLTGSRKAATVELLKQLGLA